MKAPTGDQITGLLIGIISDGFNRSLYALKHAGALDTKKLQEHYKGVGSKYYDMVTVEIDLSARYGATAIRKLFEEA